uniref:Uncharacterized protein n=1 Tax=Mesocestoides corti TaxID=53468 RepID=A0A5K3G5I0_MESCO
MSWSATSQPHAHVYSQHSRLARRRHASHAQESNQSDFSTFLVISTRQLFRPRQDKFLESTSDVDAHLTGFPLTEPQLPLHFAFLVVK